MATAASQTPQTSQQVAEREAANGLRQYDAGIEMIKMYLDPERPFALRPHMICQLQQIAVDGLEPEAGQFRKTGVGIHQSEHQPPQAHLVPFLVDEMCEYVNNNLHEATAFHLAAYVMWRLNWIHPFSEGNGRTSRIVSYIVLSLRIGCVLPGSPAIPQQIQDDRTVYIKIKALEAADAACRDGKIDVSEMETALKGMLARQLLSVIEGADGGVPAV